MLSQRPAIVEILIRAGADPDAGSDGTRAGETPLHWAASTDDVDVAEILIGAGADVDAPDGSIGTPLENAIGYGCWHVARHLVEAGATVSKLWHAAALGHLARLDLLLTTEPTPTADDVNDAFWQACHGGQFRAAQRLLEIGPDRNYHPGYADNPPTEIAAQIDTRRQQLVDCSVPVASTTSRRAWHRSSGFFAGGQACSVMRLPLAASWVSTGRGSRSRAVIVDARACCTKPMVVRGYFNAK
jgi:uncharacterized protein